MIEYIYWALYFTWASNAQLHSIFVQVEGALSRYKTFTYFSYHVFWQIKCACRPVVK